MTDKIIFLDFDGVITTVKSRWHFDPEKMTLLGDILDATDAKIVITSSWRRYTLDDTIDFITKREEERGHVPFAFPDRVIGVTDRMYGFCFPNSDRHFSVVRGEEIRRWQEEHNACECPYVILDDDTDMLLWQKDNFVKTDCEKGLSRRNVKRAIAILNREDFMTTKEAVEELKNMKYGLGKMLLLCLLFPESVIKLNKD